MHLTPREKEIFNTVISEQRVSAQAAAYTVYLQLTPKGKKTLSPKEFHRVFTDNWQAFRVLEDEEFGED